MLSIEEIRERLKDRKINAVAQAIGIHRQTLYNVANGYDRINYNTLKKLSEYLAGTNEAAR